MRASWTPFVEDACPNETQALGRLLRAAPERDRDEPAPTNPPLRRRATWTAARAWLRARALKARLRHLSSHSAVARRTFEGCELIAVNADARDAAAIMALECGGTTARIIRQMQEYLSTTGMPQCVPVLLLGAGCDLSDLPAYLQPLTVDDGRAVFEPACTTVLIPLRSNPAGTGDLARTLVHELTHAYMYLLSRGYIFPTWIREAVAVAMEARFVAGTTSRDARLRIYRDGSLGTWRIKTVLASSSRHGPLHRCICVTAYELLLFLAALDEERGALRGLLAQMRRGTVRASDVASWLEAKIGSDLESLEPKFRDFQIARTRLYVDGG